MLLKLLAFGSMACRLEEVMLFLHIFKIMSLQQMGLQFRQTLLLISMMLFATRS